MENKPKPTNKALAITSTLGFFSVLVLMFFKEVPESSRDGVNILLGFLGGMLTTAFSYYFGSSEQ